MMVDQSRAVLAKVVEDFYDALRCEDLLKVEWEPMVKGVRALQVKEVAVTVEAQLEQRNRLVAQQTLAINTKDWRWVRV